MAKEENLNKVLYKTLLYLLKVIPMVMAFICLLNTTLSYFDIMGMIGKYQLIYPVTQY